MRVSFHHIMLALAVLIVVVFLAGWLTNDYRAANRIEGEFVEKGATYVEVGQDESGLAAYVIFPSGVPKDLTPGTKVSGIEFKPGTITDDDLKRLSVLSGVESIYFINCTITAESLAPIAQLGTVRSIVFRQVTLSESQIQSLAAIGSLEGIGLMQGSTIYADAVREACPGISVANSSD